MIDIPKLSDIVKTIISHQEMIIGPIAVAQANKVSGLTVSNINNINIEVKDKNPETILTELVKRYEDLFGKASVEVCKDAVKEISPPVPVDDLPDILK